MKLFSYLNYDDCTLMNNLKNKINNCLQNILSVLRVYQDHKADKAETLINSQSTLALTLRID